MRSLASLAASSLPALALAAVASGQVTRRVSVDSAGNAGNSWSGGFVQGRSLAITPDGRHVAFESLSTNLAPGDANLWRDVFVHDRWTGVTERVSVAGSGAEGDGPSQLPSSSADGRFVVFTSEATNFFAGDTNGTADVFLRDRQLGTTQRLAAGWSWAPITPDARFVALASPDPLAAGDTNGVEDVFVLDRQLATTERVSVSTAGVQGNQWSSFPAITPDGRYVAFQSSASTLVAGDTNARAHVFVRDRQLGTTERASVGPAGAQAADASSAPAISDDGRFVAFESLSADLVPGDVNGALDVFVHDRVAGTTVRASESSGGAPGNQASRWCSISPDGRLVAFQSAATNLDPSDTNGATDVFLRDLLLGTTERVSVSSAGIQGTYSSGHSHPALARGGRLVAFDTRAALAPEDSSGGLDVYVRDRDASAFELWCEPGEGGVVPCPCGNPPSGSGRGCDNSSSTGGATLAASGAARLSGDTLVLATSGEKPAALSIVLQGTTAIAAGAVYGQGVRCAGGTLKRLYTKSAVGGSVTAPDFGAGDPSVSARSAALGDPIGAGQRRLYLVYYRDPLVLGGCPASSTFNATPTGRVDWTL